MDLNHIFLFLAVISPLVVLARTWRPGTQHHGWRIAALVVLAITAIAWFLVPTAAGYIGGLAWIALLFLPAIRRIFTVTRGNRLPQPRHRPPHGETSMSDAMRVDYQESKIEDEPILGPVLTMPDGRMKRLTLLERVLVKLRLTNAKRLEAVYFRPARS